MRKLLIFLAIATGMARAGTFTAATCNYADVNAVINGGIHTAVSGDVIIIPAGTCTWTSRLSVTVGITITGSGTPNTGTATFGAGTPTTILVDNVSSSNPMITVTGITFGQTMVIALMDIEPFTNTTALQSPLEVAGTCTSSGCPNLRVDNLIFGATTPWTETGNGSQADTMMRLDNVFGVLDHNTLPTGSSVVFANMGLSSYLGVGDFGDNSWATADSFGGANNMFLENNSIYVGGVSVTDDEFSPNGGNQGGSRQVGRYNHITSNDGFGAFGYHGLDTGGRIRSGRQLEVYGNTITCTNSSCNIIAGYRGGTGYTHDNTLINTGTGFFNSYAGIAVYRTIYTATGGWGACGNASSGSAVGAFDTNDGTTYFSGTATSGSTGLVLNDTTKSFTTNQFIPNGAPYSVFDTHVGGANFVAEIASNTGTSITIQSGIVEQVNSFAVGDTYQIRRSTVCADQGGRGAGALVSGTTPTPSAPLSQALDPIYEWNDAMSPVRMNGNMGTTTGRTIANRDWYTDNSNGTPVMQTSPTSPFAGATGVGIGTLANRPTTCTTGVGYAEYSGSNFVQLDKCTATNTWTSAAYTPYTYPHPLALVTPTSITMSWHGAVVRTGTSISVAVVCTYPGGSPAPDDCTAAGGAVWTTPTNSGTYIPLTVTGSGGTATVAWSSSATYDPYNTSTYISAFMAEGIVVVTAGGLTDSGQALAQSALHSDTFSTWMTPASNSYNDSQTGTALPINVVVGATVTVGTGFVASFNGASGNPFQQFCNYSSSNSSIATVTQFGLVTAVAPGSVTITCGLAGNGTYTTPTNSGTTFTFTVTAPTLTSQTWYVRPGGGTPYVNAGTTPAGQCNGKTNVDYPGTGVNQNCAMGNLRYLWMDQVTTGKELWMIGPGDTVIVAQNSSGYNLGPDARGADRGGTGHTPVNCTNSAQCYMPTIPSGTSAQHTRILGENYASCSADSAKTQVSPTWAAQTAFYVRDSQFVDVACFVVTDHAQCGGNSFYVNACTNAQNFGQWGIWESALTASVTYTDVFIDGLQTQGIFGATGAGVVANRVHIRGVPNVGINMDDGPWTIGNISVAGGFTMTNSITEFVGCVEEYPVVHNYPFIECRDSALSGLAPDGFGTASTTGSWVFDHDIWAYNYQDGLDLLHSGLQSLTVTNSQSYGNDGNPYKIGAATNVIFQGNLALQNGYRISAVVGDEPATAVYPNPSGTFGHSGLNMTWNSGNASVGGPGAQVVVAYTGATFTLAASTTNYFWVDNTGTIQHNTTGFPALTLGAQLGIVTATTTTLSVNNFGLPAFCRAGCDMTMQWAWNGTYSVTGNTLVGYPDVMLEYGTSPGSNNVSTAITALQNNTFLSYANTGMGQSAAAFCCVTNGATNYPPHQGWGTRSNNTFYNMRTNPAVLYTGETTAVDQKFINEVNPLVTVTVESTLDGYANTPQTNYQPSTLSALSGAGTTVPGLTVDLFGTTYSAPPPIGAVNFVSSTPTAATPTFSPGAGTYTGTQTVTISTSTGGATICYTTDGTAPLAATPGTCSHGTAGSTVSVAVSEALNAIATEASFLNSGVGTAAYVITVTTSPVSVTGGFNLTGSGSIQ